MNCYEGIFILKPGIEKDELNRLIGAIQELITTQGGQIKQVDLWGVRPLAYRIRRQTEGQYAYLCFDLEPSEVGKLGQRVKLREEILRVLISRSSSMAQGVEKGGKDGGS